MTGPRPADLTRSYTHMRSGVFATGSNTSASGMQILATHTALTMPKLMVVQDNAGAAVTTADAEMYFMPGLANSTQGQLQMRVNDQLLDQGDGTRWRIVKVFAYPSKTLVWAARDQT